MELTKNEQTILSTLKDILVETECVYSDDLISSNPKILRGALASLVKKGVIDIDKDYPSVINGETYYPVTYWDESLIKEAA